MRNVPLQPTPLEFRLQLPPVVARSSFSQSPSNALVPLHAVREFIGGELDADDLAAGWFRRRGGAVQEQEPHEDAVSATDGTRKCRFLRRPSPLPC